MCVSCPADLRGSRKELLTRLTGWFFLQHFKFKLAHLQSMNLLTSWLPFTTFYCATTLDS